MLGARMSSRAKPNSGEPLVPLKLLQRRRGVPCFSRGPPTAAQCSPDGESRLKRSAVRPVGDPERSMRPKAICVRRRAWNAAAELFRRRLEDPFVAGPALDVRPDAVDPSGKTALTVSTVFLRPLATRLFCSGFPAPADVLGRLLPVSGRLRTHRAANSAFATCPSCEQEQGNSCAAAFSRSLLLIVGHDRQCFACTRARSSGNGGAESLTVSRKALSFLRNSACSCAALAALRTLPSCPPSRRQYTSHRGALLVAES